MDYGELSRNLVADAFQNQLPGLKADVTFHFLVSQGDYDAEAGQYENTTADVGPIPVVLARPTFEEVQDGRAVATDVKCLIPGLLMTREITDETTATINGKKYTCKKGVGVPGGSLIIAYLRLT